MPKLTKKQEVRIRRDMRKLFKDNFSDDLLSKVIDDAIKGIKKSKYERRKSK